MRLAFFLGRELVPISIALCKVRINVVGNRQLMPFEFHNLGGKEVMV